MSRKKKDKRDFDALVSDTIYEIAIDALQQIIDTSVPYGNEDEELDLGMIIDAMKQKAQIALDFVSNLSNAKDEEPKQNEKEQRGYGRK